ncbi:uncharacterized protein BXIN_1286 [Babesia sp. Xinjiang]|uniref:uncharacterized protein n=1 Tax=Babesia sp. Xinjiang TaxID=462227 RepID=UPI000A2383A9|nr:uncharacterized protein BXIN_1286 [Babesia sp. Xinjiang]ORM39921.1 hypothetical protein BXIN_1286 [Babesia sp. Xinjiang]
MLLFTRALFCGAAVVCLYGRHLEALHTGVTSRDDKGQAAITADTAKSISNAAKFKQKQPVIQPQVKRKDWENGPHPCSRYNSWKQVDKIWDNLLMPRNMTICRKNYGADGNCLFNAIAGILRDHQLTRDMIGLTTTDLPASVSLSLEDTNFTDTFYTVADLRKIIAVRFVGVDPYNQAALPFWNVSELITKLEVYAGVEGTADYGDIRWEPSKFLNQIRNNGDLLDIAKKIFSRLAQVSNPYSWGSYEDIDTLAHVFNLDIYLFWSNEIRLQRFKGLRHENALRPALILYYHVMQHFDGAGVITNIDEADTIPIRSMFSVRRFPETLRQIAT